MSIDRVRRQFQVNAPLEIIPLPQALIQVERAMAKWQPQSESESRRIFNILAQAHPDQHAPEDFWLSASSKAFRDFFVWGHNHDFGHGFARTGAMGNRHLEITSELIALGMMPGDLKGQRVLDIGCWSGGATAIAPQKLPWITSAVTNSSARNRHWAWLP